MKKHPLNLFLALGMVAGLAAPSLARETSAPAASAVPLVLAPHILAPGAPELANPTGAAATYLAGRQATTGAWAGPTATLTLRDSAAAVHALALVSPTHASIISGAQWLAAQSVAGTDYLARRATALAALNRTSADDLAELAARRLPDAAFAAQAGDSAGNPFDTALALAAPGLPISAPLASESLFYLYARRRPDDGYAVNNATTSTVQASAHALLAFAAWQGSFNLQAPISALKGFLGTRRKGDNGYGDSAASTARDAALAHAALWAVSGNDATLQTQLIATRAYLSGTQSANGSWNDSVLDTALALRALAEPAATRVTGTAVDASAQVTLPGTIVSALGNSPVVTAAANVSGVFSLGGVAPGRVALQFARPGYLTRTVAANVRAGAVNDLGDVALTSLPIPLAILSDPVVYEGAYGGDFTPSATFTAQYSLPAGVSAAAVQWTSTSRNQTASGVNNTFGPRFDDQGVYTLTATLRDSLGRIQTVARAITVTNAAPVVNAGADVTATVDAAVPFAGTATDRGFADTRVGLQVNWDYGNGRSSPSLNTTAMYTAPGVYTATLTATDKDGAATSDARLITILPAAADPITGTFGITPSGALSENVVVRFFDTVTPSSLYTRTRWLWAFGDDNSVTGLPTPPHFYADGGVFPVTLTLVTPGGAIFTATQTITVANLPPVIAAPPTLTVSISQSVELLDMVRDPSLVDDASLSVRWDLGDGGVAITRGLIYTWTAYGNYTMIISATDKDGANTLVTTTVVVTDNAPLSRIRGFYGEVPIYVNARGYPNPDWLREYAVAVSGTITAHAWYLNGVLASTESYFSPNYTIGNAPLPGLHIIRGVITNSAGIAVETRRVFRKSQNASVASFSPSAVTATVGFNLRIFNEDGYCGCLNFFHVTYWGDGTSNRYVNEGSPPFPVAQANWFHTYVTSGTMQAIAYRSSQDGVYGSPVTNAVKAVDPLPPVIIVFSQTATLFNYPPCPAVPPSEGNGDNGNRCSYPANLSYTPDGSGIFDSYDGGFVYDWGDGSPRQTFQTTNARHVYVDSGVYTLTVTGRSNSGVTGTTTLIVPVLNRPPTATVGLDRELFLDEEVMVEATAWDPSPADLGNLSFAWDFGNGVTRTAAADPGAPGYNAQRYAWPAPGVFSVTLVVRDPDGGVVTDTAVYTVVNNHPPVFTSSAPDLAVVAQPYRYQPAAADPDSDPFTLTLVQAPAGMMLAPGGLISWTPTLTQAGFNQVQLVADDGKPRGRAQHVFGVNVSDQPFLPDLTVLRVGKSPVAADPQTLAASGSVSAIVRNAGLFSVTQPFSVTFFDDTDQDGAWTPGADGVLAVADAPAPLAPGQAATVTAALLPQAVVLFRDNVVYAIADAAGAIDEGDEGNNTRRSGDDARYTAPQQLFAPRVKWAWRGSPLRPNFSYNGPGNWSWVDTVPSIGPLIDTNGDGLINGDDVPMLAFVSHEELAANDGSMGVLRVIRGDTGADVWASFESEGWNQFYFSNNTDSHTLSAGTAMGDIDSDGVPEVVVPRGGNPAGFQLSVYRNNGTLKFRTANAPAATSANLPMRGAPALADLDGDGRLEMIFGHVVWNYTGTLRFEGTAGKGLTADNSRCCMSIVADLDGDGFKEVIAGNTAYRHDGAILWNAGLTPTNLADGYAAIGNMDLDPMPEVVLASEVLTPTNAPTTVDLHLTVLEHDGTVKWRAVHSRAYGGAPALADVNGDGIPEIALALQDGFGLFNGANGARLWRRDGVDFSGRTGASAFDFDGDGQYEFLWNDQRFTRILRGRDGEVLWQTANPSLTSAEMPIVADVDRDGHADLITVRNNWSLVTLLGDGNPPYIGTAVGLLDGGITVYSDAFNNWQPARSVWHQHSYHVTDVDDDGDLPTVEEPSWLRYNLYRVQVPPQRAVQRGAADLTASRLLIDASGCTGYADLIVRVGNGGSIAAPAGHVVKFYADGALATSAVVTRVLEPGQFADAVARWNAPLTGIRVISAWVDAPQDAAGVVPEPDEANNTHSRSINVCNPGNLAPIVTSLPPTQALVGVAFVYTPTVSDPNADPLTFDLLAGPSGLTLSPGTGVARWTPTDAQRGAQTISIRIWDGAGAFTVHAFTLTVELPPTTAPAPLCAIPGGAPGADEVLSNSTDDDCNPATPDVIAPGAVTATIATDRREYTANEWAMLIGQVIHAGGAPSQTLSGLTAQITVKDPGAMTVFNAGHPLGKLGPAAREDVADAFDTAALAPGAYTAEIRVLAGATQIAQASAAFDIVPAAGEAVALTGTLAVSPALVIRGRPFTVTWSAGNAGNGPLGSVAFTLAAIDPATEQVRHIYAESVGLGLGEAIARETAFTAAPGDPSPMLVVLLGSSAGATQTLASGGAVLGQTRLTFVPNTSREAGAGW